MPTAQPFNCHLCNRRIGARRTHMLSDAGPFVLCIGCYSARDTHHRLYPNCPVAWHDMHDHGTKFATRAAARQLLTAKTGSA